MKKLCLTSAAAAAFCCALAACNPAAGDADAGKKLFEQQCIDCHEAEPDDGGGMQGPSLIGLIGRAAAGDTKFRYYSKPLRDSGLTWDAGSLDRFLAAPDRAIPGTTMALAVTKPEDRQDLIVYFTRATAAHR